MTVIGPRGPLVAVSPPASPVARPAAPAPARAAAPQPAPSLLDRVGSLFRGFANFFRHVFKPFGVWHNPAAETPADASGMKVVSYNILTKGRHLDAVAADLRKLGGDVICLQESSEASARELARRLGMHVAYHEHPLHSYGGNAILSRWPIVDAEEIDLVNPWADRLKAFWSKVRGGDPRFAPLDSRHLVRATLQVGDRTVDVLNGHLTLFGDRTNARQIDQIAALSERLRAQGHTVVAAGDWNANFGVAPATPGVADAKGANASPTDTVAEFRDRYDGTAGNMGHAANQRAAARLQAGMTSFWDAPARTVRVLGQTLTVEQALAALRAEPAGTARAQALRLAVDGITSLGGRKRFDNVFVSDDARMVAGHIDQDTRASDHQPVLAEIRW